MTDLNKKQAFWAEQLPLFKEKYWLPEHLDVLEFNMDGGCFEIPIDVKTDLSEDDLFDIYHRVNSGWAMWKKAITFMQEKAKAQAVQQSFEIGRLQDRITELLDERQDLYAQINNDQAVPEHIVTLQRNGEVFKFDLLDLLRRSLKSSKVLKTRENWSHVSKMVGLGSTTSTLLCKEMNVDPDGTVFVARESGA